MLIRPNVRFGSLADMAIPSWAWMTQAVKSKISAAIGIIGPEPLHAVSNCITRWRCVICRSRIIGPRPIVSRLAVGDGAANNRAANYTGGNAGADPASIAVRVRRSWNATVPPEMTTAAAMARVVLFIAHSLSVREEYYLKIAAAAIQAGAMANTATRYCRSISALPPKADICGAQAHVRFVPEADIRGP